MIRLKAKVPVVPKTLTSQFTSQMRAMGNRLASRVDNTYKTLLGDWKSKPQFTKTVNVSQKETKVEVKTNSNVYAYVDLGTPPHIIKPKPSNPKGLLIFPGNYDAATRPESLQTRQARRYGEMQYRTIVHHPGSEARNFEKPIIEEQTPIIIKEFKDVIGNTIIIKTETL